MRKGHILTHKDILENVIYALITPQGPCLLSTIISSPQSTGSLVGQPDIITKTSRVKSVLIHTVRKAQQRAVAVQTERESFHLARTVKVSGSKAHISYGMKN